MPTQRIKTTTRFALASLAAAVLVTGALALPALAHDRGDKHGGGRGEGTHERGMHQGAFGHGPGRHMGFFEEFDTNADGKLTQEEVDAVRQERLKKFDANGDGRVSAEEFNERFAKMVRRMDRDGDGDLDADDRRERRGGGPR